MVQFVGAGPGAVDLITLRGKRCIEEADVILYAGSLVNPRVMDGHKPDCRIYDTAKMTLEQVMEVILEAEASGRKTVRLHTGDPGLYGAIREQMDVLEQHGIAYEVCPGVSAMGGAAAALGLEYTLPGISQSVVITRMAGRTPVPERESIRSFAAHRATMVLFLSAGLLEETQEELLLGGYEKDTPAAIVYKATWEEEKKLLCTVGTLSVTAKAHGIANTALIIVGDVLGAEGYERSRLYDPTFTTGFREAEKQQP